MIWRGKRQRRRVHAEERRLADQLGCSLSAARRVIRDDNERWRRVARGEITAAIALREIRADLARQVRR